MTRSGFDSGKSGRLGVCPRERALLHKGSGQPCEASTCSACVGRCSELLFCWHSLLAGLYRANSEMCYSRVISLIVTACDSQIGTSCNNHFLHI